MPFEQYLELSMFHRAVIQYELTDIIERVEEAATPPTRPKDWR